jgi:hypothetical protein
VPRQLWYERLQPERDEPEQLGFRAAGGERDTDAAGVSTKLALASIRATTRRFKERTFIVSDKRSLLAQDFAA